MVQIENLSFGYKHNTVLFENFSMQLAAGNIYGLLGKNGAGKSSLLKLMSGLLFPKSGSVRVFGCSPQARNPLFLQELYRINEEFSLPDTSIKQYTKLHSSFYPRFKHDAYTAYLQEFQLDKQQQLNSLSYGQKKKFLLAFGLATDCKLLILDEPTNGLDIPSKSQFRKVVASAIDQNRSFVISTHQVRDMESLIDPILMLDQGQLIFAQSMEQVQRKLCVNKVKTQPADGSALYTESALGTHTVVTANTTGEETHIGLELLFNAVTSQVEKAKEIFSA